MMPTKCKSLKLGYEKSMELWNEVLAIPISSLPIRITFQHGYQRMERSDMTTWIISYVIRIGEQEYESEGAGFGTWYYE
jgi:hypothetical protein